MAKIIEYTSIVDPMRPPEDKYRGIIVTEQVVSTQVEKVSFDQLEWQLKELIAQRDSIDTQIVNIKNKIKELSTALSFDYVKEIPVMTAKAIVEELPVEEPIINK